MTQPKKTAGEMFPLIERYLAGHLSQKAFCDEHGLSLAQLNYWIAKYRRQGATPQHEQSGAFVEICPAPAGEALLEVVYPSGVRLRLFSLVEPAYLERLLTFPGT